jgi:hypothetical protein
MTEDEDPGPKVKKIKQYKLETNCKSYILTILFDGHLTPNEYKLYGYLLKSYSKSNGEYPMFHVGCKTEDTEVVMHFADDKRALEAKSGIEYILGLDDELEQIRSSEKNLPQRITGLIARAKNRTILD